MNVRQAKYLFKIGKLLPYCPGCYQQQFQIAKRVEINGSIPIMALVCHSCKERFVAGIA
jgi:hypothetical protein